MYPSPLSNHDRLGSNRKKGKSKRSMEEAAYRSRRVVAEIDPHSEWVHGDEFDTLIVDVSGNAWTLAFYYFSLSF
jgi:hypothetical protein